MLHSTLMQPQVSHCDKPVRIRPAGRETGLSLIELMIAMVVGLVLIAGVLSVFLSSRKSYGVNTAVAQIQQNARFSLSYIRTATRMAGYMGCGSSSTLRSYVASNALPYNFTQALTGFEFTGTAPGDSYTITGEDPAVTTAGWSPTLDSSLPAMIPGSDVLVVRYSSGNAAPANVIGSLPQWLGGQIIFNADPNFVSGQFLLISNCVSGFVIQAYNVSGGGQFIATTPGFWGIGGSATPGNTGLTNGLPASGAPWTGAQASQALTTVFYIGQSPANGEPALFEATTNANDPSGTGFTSQELVPGVENMQVLYGVDTTGSLTPSEYVTADNVPDWSDVVSVRVALLLRSNTGAVTLPPAATTYDLLGTTITVPQDTRLRRVFTSTIMLRNR